MKKPLLTLLLAASTFAVNGQYYEGPISPSTDFHGPTAVYSNHIHNSENQPETVLFTEDFADSLHTVNGQWIASGANASLVKWDDQGPSNLIQNGWGPLPSPTASNGFAIFDLWGNHSGQFADVPMECLLTSPPISLASLGTADTTLMVEFYQQLFWCCEFGMDIYLEISTDSGQTFPYRYKTNNFGRNDRHWNMGLGYKWRFDVSEILADNPNYIFLRFNWTSLSADQNGQYSSEYFWMIDDIKVATVPKNSLEYVDVETTNTILPKIDMVFNSYFNLPRYGHLSYKQKTPVLFSANIFNFGLRAQSNVILQAEILDGNNNLVTTLSSPLITSLPSKDTVIQIQTNAWTPNQMGSYRVVLKARADSINSGNPGMALDTIPFFVTDSVWSLDHKMGHNAIGTGISSNNNPDGFEVAVRFNYEVLPQSIYGVEVHIANSSQVGGILELEVYDSTNFDMIMGFQNPPILTANHTLTQADIDNGKAYIDLSDHLGRPAQLFSEGIIVTLRMFSNNGQNHVNILNDQTLMQQYNASMMYLPSEGRWFNGYTKSKTFNAPLVRLIMCPSTSHTDCWMNLQELSTYNIKVGQDPENLYVHFNDATGNFSIEQLAKDETQCREYLSALSQPLY